MAAFEPVCGFDGKRWPQSWQKIDPSRFTRPHCWQRAIDSTFWAQATRGRTRMPKQHEAPASFVTIDREVLLC